jgi:transcriptional regulator with XRE-family HTH domain
MIRQLIMSTEFVTWLAKRLNEEGWSQRELARRAGVSPATISFVMNEQQSPTFGFCAAIARPLGLPVDELLALAGLRPSLPAPVLEEREAVRILRALPPSVRTTVLAMLRGVDPERRTRALNDTPPAYQLDPASQEILDLYQQTPDELRPEFLAQMRMFDRLARRPAARIIGEENGNPPQPDS